MDKVTSRQGLIEVETSYAYRPIRMKIRKVRGWWVVKKGNVYKIRPDSLGTARPSDE